MRLGLLGLGRIGAFHAETLAGLPAVEELVLSDRGCRPLTLTVACCCYCHPLPSAMATAASVIHGSATARTGWSFCRADDPARGISLFA
jgi:hypothetical protein